MAFVLFSRLWYVCWQKIHAPLIGRYAKLNTQNSDLDLTKNELDTLTTLEILMIL